MVIVKQYKKENYSVLFNNKTGNLIRLEKKGFDEPKFSQHGPELLDISITNWCDKGCIFCYRNSNKDGLHMNVNDYTRILEQSKECDVFQIALGGGNPNQHPNFIDILKLTREYGIVPSYTTNGRGLSEEILHASKEFCGAVAVSYYGDEDFYSGIRKLTTKGIKTNIHFLLSTETIEIIINWLKNPPVFLDKVNAIVFLNYKPIGIFKDETKLLKNSPKVREFFELINEDNFNFKIGFDSCTISFIAKYLENVDTKYVESCEAGKFSAFVDENLNLFPCSFMVEDYKGINLKEINLKDAWTNSRDIVKLRKDDLSASCGTCEKKTWCAGGCPVFKNINNECG